MKVLARVAAAALTIAVGACSGHTDTGAQSAHPRPGATAPVLAKVGELAPDFTLKSIDGTRIDLARYHGKAVFINMFATWCPPCRDELPDIVASYAAYKNKVVYIGVDEQEELDPVIPFVKQFHIAYQVGLDPGTVAEKYEVGSLPESVFIDKEGVVRKIWHGFMPAITLKDNLSAIVQD
jgi:thiol-disulfide isomerase/thioredoxin